MRHHTAPHAVQFDVTEALPVFPIFNHRGVIVQPGFLWALPATLFSAVTSYSQKKQA
jgi:hypothetical protein